MRPTVLSVVIAVTLGLYQCQGHSLRQKRASQCYDGLGCFETEGALNVLPMSPDQIQTTFTLMTQANNHAAVLHAVDSESTWRYALSVGHFDPSKEVKVITHGYLDSGSSSWVTQMASELLKHGDYNVLVTDWGHGSKATFSVATANSLLVSAQLGKMINYLHSEQGVDLSKVHLIGHSLGGQISGNAGSKARTVARITAMDPAEPYFKDTFDNSKRLDRSDATFVDVIHTDGADFNFLQGYGIQDPIGHLDFYPNGGVDQPGCTDNTWTGILGAISGGSNDNSIACSHARSYEYFIESINSQCNFTAHACNSWDNYEKGRCHGCPSGGCPQMGLNAEKSSATGSYYVSTAESDPYCGHEYFVEMDLTGSEANGYGRIYLTFMGRRRNSREVEFTRENRHYHANDKEMHMLAIHTEVGDVVGVKVRFHHGGGLPSYGTQHHITVHRIVVEDAVSRDRTIFCTHDQPLPDDRLLTFRSHSGCR